MPERTKRDTQSLVKSEDKDGSRVMSKEDPIRIYGKLKVSKRISP